MSSEELTKEEFMIACKADGTEETVCAARWEAAHAANPTVEPQPTSPGDTQYVAGLLRKIEMQDAELELRRRQLTQAISIAGRANDARKAKDDAEKQTLIKSIQLDGKFPTEILEQKSLSDLQTMRYTLDKTNLKTFASVAADLAESSRKNKPHLTAGYYDNATKTWKGGT